MTLRRPNVFLVLFALVSTFFYLGLAVWIWGDWRGFLGHPARVGVCVLTVVLAVASIFSGCAPFSRGKREDTEDHWIFVPMILITLALAGLPPYTDRLDLWSLDGDAVRYLGLAFFAVGGVLRVGAMFALGRRFSGLVAIQEGHTLLTTGLYRWVRHPSYLGALLGTAGWVLAFRSGIDLLVALLMAPLIVARMDAEEALLLSEFGEEYAAYRRRTWRLLPFVY
jgi:protein-S-isoprenylcysteine O-methyltransferase Ste14